jgi:hypothetical protein
MLTIDKIIITIDILLLVCMVIILVYVLGDFGVCQ